MNMIASDIVLLYPGNFYKPISVDSEANISQNKYAIDNMRYGKKSLNETDYLPSDIKSSPNHIALTQIRNKIPLLVLAIWIIGVGRGFIRLTVSSIELRRFIQRSDKVTDEEYIKIFSEVKGKIGLSRNTVLLVSSEIQVPFSTGIIRPCVVLPSDMLIPDDKLRMILIHELTHLKHFDDLINLMCQTTKAFMFFHLLYHLAVKELGLSSEQICDIHAVKLTGKREHYAQCLLDFSQASIAGFPVGFSTSKKLISKRVKFILEGEMMKIARKKIALLLVSLAVVILTLSSVRIINPASARAQAPQKSQIAFYSTRDGNYEVYVMDTDGNNQRNLTNNPGGDDGPAWSPDGEMIAFDSSRDGNPGIYVMDADGNNPRRLTNNPADDWSPAWSPDGKMIAFTSQRDGSSEIYAMDADGNNQRRLTNNPAHGGAPAWSPDGKMIAFYCGRDMNVDIYVMDADGSNQRRLTNEPADDHSPSWSPDGKMIAFTSQRDKNYEIYVMDADGNNQRRLTNNPASDFDPTWSPDGKMITFVSIRDGNFEIYVMDADGNNQRRLTNNPAEDGGPAWFDPAFARSVSLTGKFMSTWGWLKKAFH
jgi:Tol biopolymer transport system component/beta-lactamase regulating signal transducer with metallopeptidase domain